jgi:hypothetical protein
MIRVRFYNKRRLVHSIKGDENGLFPFKHVFDYMTCDGHFKHLMTEDALVATLSYYKLPVTLIAFSRTTNNYVYNEIVQLSERFIVRFQSFITFMYTVCHPNNTEIVEFTYFRNGRRQCVIN